MCNEIALKESGKVPKTYLVNNAGHFFAKLARQIRAIGGQREDAILRIKLSAMAQKRLKEFFNVEWHGCRLLDVGCGQLLRHALIFGVDNNVVGIDVELPFRYPYVFDFFQTLRQSGVHRAVKTLVRQSLGVDYRFRRALIRQLGVSELPEIDIYRMNAMNLEFEDSCFDGVYSFSVFQYIARPELAASEIYRVLRRGGVAYIQLHLYTSWGGSDHPLLQISREKYPPWGHLRPSTPYYQKHGLYLNCWRLGDYKSMFESVFDEVHYVYDDEERDMDRRYLTPAIQAELADYSEEELVTSTFTALCRKSS